MPLVLKWQGHRKLCVNCFLEIYGILNMPQVLNIPRFCMYQESHMLEIHRIYGKGS